jgi:transcription elongation GreA/GreB family factor
MKPINKRALLEALRTGLAEEIATMTRIAREAAEAATHEENKPEGDKDMRSTEASYIARGQAERVLELERAQQVLSSLELKSFDASTPIESSALIELRHGNKTSHYFLVGAGGGRRVTIDGVEIGTLTAVTPLGKALLGATEGDEIELESPQGVRTYEVVSVT